MAKLSVEQIKEILASVASLGEETMDATMPSVWQVPVGYILEKFQVNGVFVEHLRPKEKTSDLVIYQLHGGAYVVRYMDLYRELAVKYSKASGGAEVYSIDYGCAPNHVFPSALKESVSVYQWLLEQGVEGKNIVIEGDSAGGNLALATTMYLRDHQVQMPRAMVLFSPWASLEKDFASIEKNKTKDLVIGESCPFGFNQVLNPAYAGDTDKKTPYLSPLYGDYHELPPMLIQCGDYEILYDQIVGTAENAKAAGVDVTFQVYKGMSHVFQLSLPMLDESEEAWKDIEAFFAKVLEMKEERQPV